MAVDVRYFVAEMYTSREEVFSFQNKWFSIAFR